MNERKGLVGASPVGNRWRSQGYIHGSVTYLGTYDTEEEAHEIYVKTKADAEQKKADEEAARLQEILDGPTYLYENGIGRGAQNNGKRFKLWEPEDTFSDQFSVVEISEDGELQPPPRRLNRRYFSRIEFAIAVDPDVPAPAPEETPRTGSVTVAPLESEGLLLDTMEGDPVERALSRLESISDPETLASLPKGVADAILMTKASLVAGTQAAQEIRNKRADLKACVVRVLIPEGGGRRQPQEESEVRAILMDGSQFRLRPDVPTDPTDLLRLISGSLEVQEGVSWFRRHTTVPPEILDEIDRDLMNIWGDGDFDRALYERTFKQTLSG